MKRTKSGHLILAYAVILLASGATTLAFSDWMRATKWPYTDDSYGYIRAAQSVMAGHGFKVVPRGTQHVKADQVPLTTFPMGYPLAIAAVSVVGLEAEEAARWVSMLSWLLLPVAFVWLFSSVIGFPLSLVVAALTFISPGVISHGYKGVSDVPYLFLTVVSIGTLLKGWGASAGRSPGCLCLVSGVTAGLAYIVRNVGLALIVASVASLAVSVLVKELRFRTRLGNAALWALGLLLVLGPNTLYNVTVLGSMNPYFGERPPPQFGLLENVQHFMASLAYEVTTLWSVSQQLRQLPVGVSVYVLGVMALGLLFWRNWGRYTVAERSAIATLGLYLVVASSAVVVAQSLYSIERSGPRLQMQQAWPIIILMVLALGGYRIWESKYRAAFTVCALVGLLSTHALYVAAYVRDPPNHRILAAQDVELRDAVCRIPGDALVFSNLGNFLGIETRRSVRHIEVETAGALPDVLATIENHVASRNIGRPIYVVYFWAVGRRDSTHGPTAPEVDGRALPPGFAVVTRTRFAAVITNRLSESRGGASVDNSSGQTSLDLPSRGDAASWAPSGCREWVSAHKGQRPSRAIVQPAG
jgi:hypothetical protein